MKKVLLLVVMILAVGGAVFFSTGRPEKKTAQVVINNQTWTVETAEAEASRTRGLSGRETLPPQTGLLFIFDRPAVQTFWMKDMLIPLDIIFFDEQWQIVLVEENLTPASFPKTFGAGVLSKYVLEINAGEAKKSGLQVKNQVRFFVK